MAHRYNLRNRAGPASLETPDQPIPGAFSRAARVEDVSDIDDYHPPPSSKLSKYILDEERPGSPTSRLYSDVAASRTPSPVAGDATSLSDDEREPSEVPTTGSFDSRAASPVRPALIKKEIDEGNWTTVSHKRRHSKDLGGRISPPRTPVGSPSYHQLVRNLASMTIEDPGSDPVSSTPSPEAGPSSFRKGKSIDPREWGGLDISQAELDPEAQRRELEAYSKGSDPSVHNSVEALIDDSDYDSEAERALLAHWKSIKENRAQAKKRTGKTIRFEPPQEGTHLSVKDKPPHLKATPSVSPRTASQEVVNAISSALPGPSRAKNRATDLLPPSAPAEQIAPLSYLGVALKDARGTRRAMGHYPQGGSTMSISAPPLQQRGGKTNSAGNNPSSCAHCHNNGHSVVSCQPTFSHQAVLDDRPLMRPAKPSSYDGTQDPEKYLLFMRQVTEYLNSYRIPPGGIPAAVSQFLTGKAYRYYINTLADSAEEWDLHGVLVGLFNYCFPIDFRMRMRRKLKHFVQGSHSVRDYAQELDMMIKMVGSKDPEDRIQRLWDGFSGSIQQALWEHKLSPFSNTWDHILQEAEYIEASKRLNHHRDTSQMGSGGARTRSNHSSAKPHNGRQERQHFSGENHRSRSSGSAPRHTSKLTQRTNNSTSRLSDEKKSELRATGKCFNCESPDHFSRNCPHKDKLKSFSKGKAPGIPSYSVEPDFSDAEELLALREAASGIDDVDLGVVSLANIDIDILCLSSADRHHNDWSSPQVTTSEDLPYLDSVLSESELSGYSPDWFSEHPETPSDVCSDGNVEIPSGLDVYCSPEFYPKYENSDNDSMPDLQPVDYESDAYEAEEAGAHTNSVTSDVPEDDWESSSYTTCTYAQSDEEYSSTQHGSGLGDGQSPEPWITQSIPLPSRFRSCKKRLSRMGTVYSKRIAELLSEYIPTHGCNIAGDFSAPDFNEFVAYPINSGSHIILHENIDTDVILDNVYMRDAPFNVVGWYCSYLRKQCSLNIPCSECTRTDYEEFGDVILPAAAQILNEAIPYPSSEKLRTDAPPRFECYWGDRFTAIIGDNYLLRKFRFPRFLLENSCFDLVNAYAVKACLSLDPTFGTADLNGELEYLFSEPLDHHESVYYWYSQIELNGIKAGGHTPHDSIPAMQRNAAVTKDFRRLLPEPAVVVVSINGNPARALLDSGSMSDFMSSKLAHQLGVKTFELEKALPVQLAVQGSRARVSLGCKAQIRYQAVDEERHFDIINLLNYDLILGTPFMFQHKVVLGLNPTTIVIGSGPALPIEGKRVRILESRAAEIYEDKLEEARILLREYAAPICQEASDAPLPPLRAVNHTIPLKDPSKVYSWRPSKCPDAHRSSWIEKRDAYLKSGRWKMTSARNTSPMMLLTKPGTGVNGVPARLRVVADLRERNANTAKLTSPLPDMEGILRRVSRKKYRSLIDGKDAYEHIRVVPEHVDRTAMTTPDGNMVSLVMQQGDCNAVATYQTLMNHIFGPYIGVFMDVYLDDVVIYSDTLSDHIQHCKTVIDVLKREKLYLSATKLRFLNSEMKILGRIVDDQGIRMDPHKVDSVSNWKVPTSKELLRGFLGSVGYLADDIATVRIPMGILTALTSGDVSFKWEFTHQRAFDEIKHLVQQHRDHHRVPLNYSENAEPIWLVTDGSVGGIAGVVMQGPTWKSGRVAAFYSAKLTSAQSNYPVHEIEMLAGVESMLRHRDILLGCAFTWVTDHKGLTHLLSQRNLSGRQARWIEKISEYDFRVEYVPGVDNVLADALSRIYSNDKAGTVRSASEYAEHDNDNVILTSLASLAISSPVYVGLEALAMQPSEPRRSARLQALPEKTGPGAGGRKPPGPVNVRPYLTAKRPQSGGRIPATLPAPPLPVPTDRTESGAGTVRPKIRTPKVVAPPESGRPETAKEFSKRIKRVVLHVSKQPQEGERDTDQPDISNAATLGSETANEDSSRIFIQHVSEATDGLQLESELKGKYSADPFFRVILDSPKDFKNFYVVPENPDPKNKKFRVKDELVFLKDKGRHLLCIPDVQINGRSPREVVILHAHSLLAHLGASKTLNLLRDHVWWKTMVRDVQTYCDTCMTCKRSKPNNQRPYGLLNPLSVPKEPWEGIGIDFVGPLPESKDRNASYDSITVIIDLLSGMVHLVPSRTNYTAKQIAELIFSEVYKLHGVPKYIVSDRDSLFTSTFWTHLHKLIGTELRMSSAYHPESDGSTERANRTVTQMLRQCIGTHQKDWVNKLPSVEFAINLARSDSTGYSPFFLNTGRMPRPMIWNNAALDEYPGVRVYAQKVKHAIMSAHDSIIAARVKQTKDANKRRRPSPFSKGDLVYVSTKNMSLPKGLARKLIPKFIGPYLIIEDFKNNSYRLELPSNLKRRGIHNVFHSSLLRIHEPNDDRLFPGRLESQVAELEDQEGEWVIDKLLAHAGKGADAVFEVLWKSGDHTWLPYSALAKSDAMVTYLELQGAERIADLADGKGTPPTTDPQVYLGVMDVGSSEPIIRWTDLYRKIQTPLATLSLFNSPPLPIASDITILNSPMAILSRPVENGHIFDDPNNPGITFFFNHNTIYDCLKYDRALRQGEISIADGPIPVSYNTLRRCWAHAYPNDPCQISALALPSGKLTVAGRTIPFERLIPADALRLIQGHGNTSHTEPSDNTLSDYQRRTVDDLLWLQARNAIRTDKRIDASKQRRLEEKKKKAHARRTAGNKARKERTNSVAPGEASSSATTIDLLGSDEPMDIHEDARGSTSATDVVSDEDDELIEYQEGAAEEGKAAGKGKDIAK